MKAAALDVGDRLVLKGDMQERLSDPEYQSLIVLRLSHRREQELWQTSTRQL